MKFAEWLANRQACQEAVAWVGNSTLRTCWRDCQMACWQLWLLRHLPLTPGMKRPLAWFCIWVARKRARELDPAARKRLRYRLTRLAAGLRRGQYVRYCAGCRLGETSETDFETSVRHCWESFQGNSIPINQITTLAWRWTWPNVRPPVRVQLRREAAMADELRRLIPFGALVPSLPRCLGGTYVPAGRT